MRSPARRKCQFWMQIGYGVSPRPLGFGTTWYSPDRYVRPDRNGIDIRCQIGLEEFRPLYRTHPMGQTTGQSLSTVGGLISKFFAPSMSFEYFISWDSKDSSQFNSLLPLLVYIMTKLFSIESGGSIFWPLGDRSLFVPFFEAFLLASRQESQSGVRIWGGGLGTGNAFDVSTLTGGAPDIDKLIRLSAPYTLAYQVE